MPDYVAALRGQMGDWGYYVTTMKLAKVASSTKFVEDIHKNDELDDLMQREIGKRVEKEMVPYLLNQPQRFYGALIVAVYGGDPEFHPVRIDEHRLIDDTDDASSYGFGLLRFDGSQIFFALDGQHRLKSIQLALDRNPDLGKEEVTVIIVKHENTPEGLSRTRRLFSTLNRRAEKTSTGLNIAIDEDDAVAIITRRLVKEHPYLGKLKWVKANKEGLNSKQLSTAPKDEPYLTTLQTLYESNELLLMAFDGGMDVDTNFKANRPDSETLDAFYDFLSTLWMDIFDASEEMQPVIQGRRKPGALRIPAKAGGGGNAIARPIGQLIVAEIVSSALRQGQEQKDFINQIFKETSFDLDSVPWRKVVWNPDARTIIGGRKERALIVNLLLDKFGLKSSMGRRQLLDDYRKIAQDSKMKLLSTDKPKDPAEAADSHLTNTPLPSATIETPQNDTLPVKTSLSQESEESQVDETKTSKSGDA